MLACFKPATKDGSRTAAEAVIPRVHPLSDSYVRAWQDKTLGFSFSGGGFMMPYIIGIAKVWTALGIITPDTALAGASAGALLCASICCGFSPQEIMDNFLAVAEDCRQHGVEGRLIHVLREQMTRAVPQDGHERCNGQLHVALTKLKVGYLKSKMISHFHSREDLIEFRGRAVMDGGVTNILPDPPNVERIIRVLCLPSAAFTQLPVFRKKRALECCNLSPDRYTTWPHTPQATLQHALNPASKEFLMGLLRLGEQDALTWVYEQGFMAAIPPSRLPPQLPEPHHKFADKHSSCRSAVGQDGMTDLLVPAHHCAAVRAAIGATTA